MFGTAKKHASRVGHKPVKVLFSIQLGSVHMTRFSTIQDQANLSVCFERGGKVSATTNIVYDKPAYAREMVVEFHEKIELIATLYKDSRTGKYQDKTGKLILRERIKAGRFGNDSYKGLGRYNLALHDIMNQMGFDRTLTRDLTIKFALVAGTTMKMILTATIISTGNENDDTQSIASYVSDNSDMSTLAASFAYSRVSSRPSTTHTDSPHANTNADRDRNEEDEGSEGKYNGKCAVLTGLNNAVVSADRPHRGFFQWSPRNKPVTNPNEKSDDNVYKPSSGCRKEESSLGWEVFEDDNDNNSSDNNQTIHENQEEVEETIDTHVGGDSGTNNDCDDVRSATGSTYKVSQSSPSDSNHSSKSEPKATHSNRFIRSIFSSNSSSKIQSPAAAASAQCDTDIEVEYDQYEQSNQIHNTHSHSGDVSATADTQICASTDRNSTREEADTVISLTSPSSPSRSDSSNKKSGHKLLSKILKPLHLRASHKASSETTGEDKHSEFPPLRIPLSPLSSQPLASSDRADPDSVRSRVSTSSASEASREAFSLYDQELARRAKHIQQLEATIAEHTTKSFSQITSLRHELEQTSAALKRERLTRKVIAEATHKGDDVLAAALSEARDEAASAVAQLEYAKADLSEVRNELHMCKEQMREMQLRQVDEMSLAQQAAAVAAEASVKRAEAEEEGQQMLDKLIETKMEVANMSTLLDEERRAKAQLHKRLLQYAQQVATLEVKYAQLQNREEEVAGVEWR